MVKIDRAGSLHLKPVDTKKQRAMHAFNRNCLFLLVVILLALGVTFGRSFDLHGNVFYGHALWFLLLPAYPLLGVLGIVNAIFHLDEAMVVSYFVAVNPALGLSLLDLVTLGIVWVIVRRRGFRWFGVDGVHAAANFVLILYAWGIFQLVLSGVMMLTNNEASAPGVPPPPPAVKQDANL